MGRVSRTAFAERLCAGFVGDGCELSPINFAEFARTGGGEGFIIEHHDECGDTLDRALRTKGPTVIEAVVDTNEPPMPPKVTAHQTAHFAEALAKGTPDRKKIAPVHGHGSQCDLQRVC